MIREEQIDLRRQRARAAALEISRLGKNRVFGDYRVRNPQSGGEYTVAVRGFSVGDNTCTCPDFKANTLGTCKHIEAVLAQLEDEAPEHIRTRKAAVTRPEIALHYGERLQLELRLPPRHSDALAALARRFFDKQHLWAGGEQFTELHAATQAVPEQVTVFGDAMEYIETAIDRQELLAKEAELLSQVTRVEEGMLDGLLHVPLPEYQLRGAIFAACRGRCILGDDMGLGKTVQSLAAVELLARLRGVERVLVVAPASLKYQWEAEIKRFTDRGVQVVEGSPEERQRQYDTPAFYRLVNYEQVTKDMPALNATKPQMVILDEAQRIKNWENKTTRAVKKLRSRYALVLTGTPLENNLEELLSIVQFVDERQLGPAFRFLEEHRELDAEGKLVGYRNLQLIRDRLAPVFLRRTRAEVLGQLPERTDSTLVVELAPRQRELYAEQRAALAHLLGRKLPTDLDRKRILACLANLRMVCGSASLLDPDSAEPSPKLDEFRELVRKLRDDGGDHKAVAFSQWEGMVSLAAGVLDELGVGYTTLDGRLPPRERQQRTEQFRDDPACRVFLSTDAGATGLNLQSADTVVNLEVPWNPAVLEQRIARVHRMGQRRPVRVVNVVARGTIEERVLAVVAQKRGLFTGLFEGGSDEVDFAASQRVGFFDTVREALAEPEPAAAVAASPLWMAAAVQMVEALAEAWAAVPLELRERARAATQRWQE